MQITHGHIFVQRFFDIAEEIDLSRAEALMQKLYRPRPFQAHGQKPQGRRRVRVPNPPLEMDLGRRPLNIGTFADADVTVRLYAVGAVSVTFSLELANPTSPEQLVHLGATILDTSTEEAITAAALPIAVEISQGVRSACKGWQMSALSEDYTIFTIQKTSPNLAAENLAEHLDIPRLLLGESEKLARRERSHHDSSRGAFSYSPNDLIVIDWNSALIVDPENSPDLPAVLEAGTLQHFELRVYDHMLEQALNNLYDELDETKPNVFSQRRYQQMSRQLMRMFIDVSETTDRIDNALQFFGDSWMARVHRHAVQTFEVPRWQAQLRQKLDALMKFNQLLVDQITTQKGLRLEWAIVLLILVEILFGLFKVW